MPGAFLIEMCRWAGGALSLLAARGSVGKRAAVTADHSQGGGISQP